MLFDKKKQWIKYLGLLWVTPIFFPLSFYIDNVFSLFTILFIPVVFVHFLKNGTVVNKYFIKIYIVFFVYIVLSSVFITPFDLSVFKYLNLYFQGILTFLIIVLIYDKGDIELVSKWIVLLVFLSFLLGLYQDSIGLGKLEVVNNLKRQVLKTYTRPILKGFDPNYYYLHIILPMVFCLKKYKEKVGYIKIIYILLALIFFYNVIILASKSALIVTVFLVILSSLNSIKNVFKLILFIVLFILFGLPLLQEFVPYSFHRYQGLLSGDVDKVTTGRSFVWELSINSFLNNPIFGIGLGQTVNLFSLNPDLVRIGAQTTHNTLLHTLSENGLVGCLLLFTPYLKLLKNTYHNNKYLFLVLFGSLIMILSIDAGYYKVLFVYLALATLSFSHINTNRC